MSFLGGGGAECSTAGNPLSQFTKHVQDDKSLQRDRLVGRGPGGSMQGMRSGNGMSMNGSQDNVSFSYLGYASFLFRSFFWWD
jgi:peroxin-5